MAVLEITVEQILELIQQLPVDSKQLIFEILRQEIAETPLDPNLVLDDESKVWLEVELTNDLPAYDWGTAGIPEGLPVTYVSGQGMVILEANNVES